MLMKKSQYKSVMFTVSICLASILLAILVAYACDLSALADARNRAYDAYKRAEDTVKTHKNREPYAVVIGTVATTTGVVVRNGVAYLATGAALGTVTSGGIILGAGAAAWVTWYGILCMYEGELDTKRSEYYERVKDYEACANPPERYTYTDYSGYVYEFSSKEAYNDFLRNRGLSTI